MGKGPGLNLPIDALFLSSEGGVRRGETALLPLPAILDNIEGIGHAIYADDIAIWTSKAGSDGWMEEALQHAANTVQEYAQSCGLSCSPQKSELLVIAPSRKKSERPSITLTIDGTDIKPSNQVRILGLLIQENGKAGAPIAKLKRHRIRSST